MKFERILDHTLFSTEQDNLVVLDLGANRGKFFDIMTQRHGGTYVLVEANPALASELAARTSHRVLNCAVCKRPGEIQFNVSENDEGSSIYALPRRSKFGCVLDKTVTVPARTFSSIVEEIDASSIYLVKMDIEGAEVEVIPSIPDACLEKIAQISVEFHCKEEFGFNLLQETSYSIQYLNERGFAHIDFSHGSKLDVLFLNMKLLGITNVDILAQKLKMKSQRLIIKGSPYIPRAIKTFGKVSSCVKHDGLRLGKA